MKSIISIIHSSLQVVVLSCISISWILIHVYLLVDIAPHRILIVIVGISGISLPLYLIFKRIGKGVENE